MKKLPIEQHKKRVLVFIEPEITDLLTVKTCQKLAKEAIKKEYRRVKMKGQPSGIAPQRSSVTEVA